MAYPARAAICPRYRSCGRQLPSRNGWTWFTSPSPGPTRLEDPSSPDPHQSGHHDAAVNFGHAGFDEPPRPEPAPVLSTERQLQNPAMRRDLRGPADGRPWPMPNGWAGMRALIGRRLRYCLRLGGRPSTVAGRRSNWTGQRGGSMTGIRRLEIWKDQCEAAGSIRPQYGVGSAFDQAVGETCSPSRRQRMSTRSSRGLCRGSSRSSGACPRPRKSRSTRRGSKARVSSGLWTQWMITMRSWTTSPPRKPRRAASRS